MDRRRRRAAVLAALVLSPVGTALAGEAPLRALRWLAPGADPVQAMTRAPAECLRRPADARSALAVEVGRAAFRNPLLLGGQAARAGIACETCHRSGRGNPDFFLAGLSGPPGTADVTSSLMSSHRGDGINDPRPIPDLSGPRSELKLAGDSSQPALERFLRGLVVEEFDGREPPPAVLAGLAAYVRHLDPAACPPEPEMALTPRLYLEDARRAVRAAQALARTDDAGAALEMVAAARSRLGMIDERYAGPALAAERAALARADARLAEAAEALRNRRPDAAAATLDEWLGQSPALARSLAQRAPVSLFEPAQLKRAVAEALPAEAP